MGKPLRVSALAIAVALLLQATPARAQLQERLAAYTGRNAKGYFAPLVDAFAADLTSGWFHSAYIPERSLSVSLELRAMTVSFSDADRTFKATTEGFFQPVTKAMVPTVVGRSRPVFVDGYDGLRYAFPAGFDMRSFSTAVPQLRIGSIYGTEAIVRYAYLNRPTALFGDLHFDLYGAGIRHSVSQYLGDFPVAMAASLLAQRFKMSEQGASYDVVSATTVSLGLQASRSFSILKSFGISVEPYTGVSWDRYAFQAVYETAEGTDRAEIDFGWQDVAQLTLGASLRVALISVSGEYNILGTASKHRKNAFSVGVGVHYTRLPKP